MLCWAAHYAQPSEDAYHHLYAYSVPAMAPGGVCAKGGQIRTTSQIDPSCEVE